MLTTTQIILRLILSLIFGLIILWFRKNKEKILEVKIYLLFSLAGVSLSLFSLKIFLTYYSKTDLIILPAAITLSIFLAGRAMIQKEETREAIMTILFLWLTTLVGLSIGFGFYELAIFVTFLALLLNLSSNSFQTQFFKQLWQKIKKQSGKK